jgi:hypothetical protein
MGKLKGIGPNHIELPLCFALDICNSPYLYVVSVIRQVAKVATQCIYGAIHYNSIITSSQ